MDYSHIDDEITRAVAFQLNSFDSHSAHNYRDIKASIDSAMARYCNDPVFHTRVLAIVANVMAIVVGKRDAALDALLEFSRCDFNDGNCASLEVAAARVRNLAITALRYSNEKETRV